MNFLRVLVAALSAVALGGCVETNDEYTLNPDGSGKVRHTASFQQVNLGEEKATTANQAARAAQTELEKAAGVEAWRDVTCALGSDGRVQFSGTAYFRDLNKLKFHNNGTSQSLLSARWQNNVLELVTEKKDKPAKAKPAPQTEEELTKAVAEVRANWQRMKPMLSGFLGTMKQEQSFLLPGTVGESSNFKREADGRLRIELAGQKMLDFMDKTFADEAKLRAAVKAGKDVMKDGPEDGLELNRELFGEAKPVRAVVAPSGKPLFDYATDVAAAKAAMPALMKKFGAAPPVALAPAGTNALKSVTVAGVRWVRVVDEKRGLRPFNWSAGYTLSVIAEFPGAVLSVKGGKLDKAEADDGTNLLPEREWDRQLEFPQLSKDKGAAVFGVKLASPSDNVRGFREISGTISYLVSENTRKVDLGFAKIAAGETGKELDASLKSLKPNQWDKERTDIELKFAGRADMVKEIELFTATGEKMEAEQRGHSQMNNQTTLTLSVKGPLPTDGKLVMEIWDGLQQFDAPFALKNISLVGTPLR